MKVQDLENWPPKPGEFFETSPTTPSPHVSIIKGVMCARDNWIIFSCEFGGGEYPYLFVTKDEVMPLMLKAILEANIGKSLLSVGQTEILEN